MIFLDCIIVNTSFDNLNMLIFFGKNWFSALLCLILRDDCCVVELEGKDWLVGWKKWGSRYALYFLA